eukprot:5331673-Prymnesium_polylepis.1
MRDSALVGGKSASMLQGGREVQAGPSETATPACGARGGRPLFAPFAYLLPDCARRMTMRKELQPCAWCHVAKVGPMDPGSCMRLYSRPEPKPTRIRDIVWVQ